MVSYDKLKEGLMSKNEGLTSDEFNKFFKRYLFTFAVFTLNATVLANHLSRGSLLLSGGLLVLLVALFLCDCSLMVEDVEHFSKISAFLEKRWKLIIVLSFMINIVMYGLV